jgi:hypothetical protein
MFSNVFNQMFCQILHFFVRIVKYNLNIWRKILPANVKVYVLKNFIGRRAENEYVVRSHLREQFRALRWGFKIEFERLTKRHEK